MMPRPTYGSRIHFRNEIPLYATWRNSIWYSASMAKSDTRKPVESAKKSSGGSQYLSRAVSKSLKVLELLQSARSPMGLQDIARRIQLSKTSTFRLLRTLEAAGCLVSVGSGEYRLAPGIHSVVPTLWLARLLRVATLRMQELNTQLRETVSLAALFDNRVEVVAVIESPQIIKMSNVVGHILPPNASSLGKVIAAFQSQEQREKLLRSYGFWHFTEHSITDPAKVQDEFSRVLADKFATDREESVPDGICFGVPVFNAAGEVNVALSASVPKMRVRDRDHEKAIVAALRATAENISSDFRAAQTLELVSTSRGRR
jgi:DNA-binding IclR family transcriptional regulator